MKQQNEFAAIISDKRRLRAATADFPTDKLEKVKVKLEQIIAQRHAEEEQALKYKQQARETAERSIKSLQDALGISRDEAIDLILESGGKGKSSGTDHKAPPVKIPPKYETIDENGTIYQWSGRGRMPNAFKSAIKAGGTLNDMLIKSEG